MQISERQKLILGKVLDEYIDSARPVSSKFLEEKYNLGICPATVRIEMQKLTDKGYLEQPHTSAGRVPTDKAYRLFVDGIMEHKSQNYDEGLLIQLREFEKELDESIQFAHAITKKIASMTSSLAMSYLSEEDIFLKEGWEDIVKEPEFENSEFLTSFASMIEKWEKGIDGLDIPEDLQIFIGRENPIPRTKEFTAIVSRLKLPGGEEGVFTIFGPKRMDYDRNILIVNSLLRLIKE